MQELGFVTQHEIKITPTCNKGFIIKIGCAMIAAASITELRYILEKYFFDPEGWEKKYNEVQGSENAEAVPTARPEPRNINQPKSEEV